MLSQLGQVKGKAFSILFGNCVGLPSAPRLFSLSFKEHALFFLCGKEQLLTIILSGMMIIRTDSISLVRARGS